MPRVSNDKTLMDAVRQAGEFRVAAAFRKCTFIYGTAGAGSLIVRGLKRWSDRAKRPEYVGKPVLPVHSPQEIVRLQQENQQEIARRKQQQMVIGRELNLFDPGRRAEQYLAQGYQMMDLYYGQAGTTLHLMRDPAIAEYVHYAMGFAGEFMMKESGREAYLRTFKTKIEGWHRDTPSIAEYGITATKEMSRVIRWGIKTFGGTLVFEGREVFYGQVFDKAAPYCGDTDLEAQELFQYFKPGLSTVPFGKGTLIFHWKGKETIPTHAHFLSNWHWDSTKSGAMHDPKNRTNEVMKKNLMGMKSVDMRPIWDNFLDMPKGMAGMKFEEVVRMIITFLQ